MAGAKYPLVEVRKRPIEVFHWSSIAWLEILRELLPVFVPSVSGLGFVTWHGRTPLVWGGGEQRNKLRPKWSRRTVLNGYWGFCQPKVLVNWQETWLLGELLEESIYFWLELVSASQKNGWVTLEGNSWSRKYAMYSMWFFGEFVVRRLDQITAREIIWKWGGYQKHLTPGSQSRESGDSWEISGAFFFCFIFGPKLWNPFFLWPEIKYHICWTVISSEHQKHQWCDVEPKSATRHQSGQQFFLNLNLFIFLNWESDEGQTIGSHFHFEIRLKCCDHTTTAPKIWWIFMMIWRKTLWQTHFCLFPRNPKPLTKWRRLFHQSSPRHDTFYRVRFVAKTRNSLRELSSPSRSKVFETTPRKLTWQRKITIFSRRCHVSFPGCKEFRNIQIRLVLGAGIR